MLSTRCCTTSIVPGAYEPLIAAKVRATTAVSHVQSKYKSVAVMIPTLGLYTALVVPVHVKCVRFSCTTCKPGSLLFRGIWQACSQHIKLDAVNKVEGGYL